MAVAGVGSRADAEARLGLSSGHISPGAQIEWSEGGRYVKIRMINGKKGKKKRVGIRGAVRGFSHASRTRMQQKLAQIPTDVPLPIMMTLTYHLKWPDDGVGWHDHLDIFFKDFEQSYGQHPIVWKMEYQERGAPHFHLLIFMGTDVDIPWVKWLWTRIAGAGSVPHGTQGVSRVERVRSWRGVASYTAKYFAKFTQSGDDDTASGRHWGVRRWALLGVEVCRKLLTQREGLRLRWLIEAVQLAGGYKPRFRRLYEGLWTFLDSENVKRLIDHVERESIGAILGYGAGGP